MKGERDDEGGNDGSGVLPSLDLLCESETDASVFKNHVGVVGSISEGLGSEGGGWGQDEEGRRRVSICARRNLGRFKLTLNRLEAFQKLVRSSIDLLGVLHRSRTSERREGGEGDMEGGGGGESKLTISERTSSGRKGRGAGGISRGSWIRWREMKMVSIGRKSRKARESMLMVGGKERKGSDETS